MNLREELKNYYNKTPVPQELAPDKINGFVHPPAVKKQTVLKKEESVKEEATLAPKVTPTPKPDDTKEPKTSDEEKKKIGASDLIRVVRHNKLSGSEFLGVLGNSKISNKAYQEIEGNPSLTVKRLIEILEESDLTESDYKKLIIAVQRVGELKAQVKEAPAVHTEKKEEPRLNQSEEIDKAVKEEPEAKPEPVKLAEENENSGRKKFAVEKDDDDDEDEEDEDDDDEDDGEDLGKNPSNKGKFIAAAIGAAVIIALSFGIRYYYTGSFLPQQNNSEKAGTVLTSESLFEKLSPYSDKAYAVFEQNRDYAVGGNREEKNLLNIISSEKRLVYFYENTLYIFEQIGGQLKQLDARAYDEDVKILGLAQAGDKIALLSEYEGDEYSFSYSVENEDGTLTSVNSSVKRGEVIIELMDAASPETFGTLSSVNEIRLSGQFVSLYTEGEKIIVVTSDSVSEGAAAQESASFMPYITSGGEKQLCGAENIIVAENPLTASITSIFSLNIEDNTFGIYAMCGAEKTLVSKNENTIFLGGDGTLASFDLSDGISFANSASVKGSFEEFSAVGSYGGEIRAVTFSEGAALLTVMNEEMQPLGEVENIAAGETPKAVCFNGSETYIVTQSGALFGIDGENNTMQSANGEISDQKLLRYNDEILVKIIASGSDELRTGIKVITLDNDLTEISSLEINSKTGAPNALDEYISSPAENDLSLVGSDSNILAVPIVYFDGVSQVETVVLLNVSDSGTLSLGGGISDYDKNSRLFAARVNSGILTVITENKISTARVSDSVIIGYFTVES